MPTQTAIASARIEITYTDGRTQTVDLESLPDLPITGHINGHAEPILDEAASAEHGWAVHRPGLATADIALAGPIAIRPSE